MKNDQLKEERLKILNMLSEGVITAKEAEDLLSAMESEEVTPEVVAQPRKGPFKLLKIMINSEDGDVVNIKIPVEFAKLLKNKKFQSNFNGVDVDVDSIIEMVTQGMEGEIVNVASADGDTVKIVVE